MIDHNLRFFPYLALALMGSLCFLIIFKHYSYVVDFYVFLKLDVFLFTESSVSVYYCKSWVKHLKFIFFISIIIPFCSSFLQFSIIFSVEEKKWLLKFTDDVFSSFINARKISTSSSLNSRALMMLS